MTIAFENAILTRNALRHGEEALQRMREAHERAAREIALYEARYAAANGLADKADILNWAIAYVCTGVMPNVHINQVASAQAELCAVATKQTAS